jgi:hypothetical protein
MGMRAESDGSRYTTMAEYKVFFEETGEERIVTHLCRRCKERTRFPFTIREAPLVSPRGVGHDQHDVYDDRTLCGKDATGERWWWRL